MVTIQEQVYPGMLLNAFSSISISIMSIGDRGIKRDSGGYCLAARQPYKAPTANIRHWRNVRWLESKGHFLAGFHATLGFWYEQCVLRLFIKV